MATPTSTSRAAKDGHHKLGRLITLPDGTEAFVPNSDTSPIIGNSRIADGAEIYSVVHKFGRNAAVINTAFVPITNGGIYRMPQVSGARTLRVAAGDANDTAAGSGAREVTVQGLDETGVLIEVALVTAGTSAGPASTETFIREFRAFVSKSGTYASVGVGSHAADIVIESAAGETAMTISALVIERAQSQVGAFTTSLGTQTYLNSVFASVDSNKTVDIILCKRENILQTAPPYSAMRIASEFNGIAIPFSPEIKVPMGPFDPLTDLLWMAKVGAQTGAVSIDFELLVKDI